MHKAGFLAFWDVAIPEMGRIFALIVHRLCFFDWRSYTLWTNRANYQVVVMQYVLIRLRLGAIRAGAFAAGGGKGCHA